jgi:hypothetical protein
VIATIAWIFRSLGGSRATRRLVRRDSAFIIIEAAARRVFRAHECKHWMNLSHRSKTQRSSEWEYALEDNPAHLAATVGVKNHLAVSFY